LRKFGDQEVPGTKNQSNQFWGSSVATSPGGEVFHGFPDGKGASYVFNQKRPKDAQIPYP